MNQSIFIVAVVLVATAAGQISLDSFDRFHERQDASSLGFYNRPLYSRSLRRLLGHPLERSLIYGEALQVPAYLQDDIFDVTLLQLDDVIMHPLFPVYMSLPYFQYYWQYPMFQKYVASQYFQRFWQLPSFQDYFRSTHLFYKYIYPLVTIYRQDTTTYRLPGYPFYFPAVTSKLYSTSAGNLELYHTSLMDRFISQGESQAQQQYGSSAPKETIVKETVGKIADPSVGDAVLVDETVTSTEDSDESTSTEQETYRNYKPSYHFNPLMHMLNGY